jgi:hypothetical protein
VVAIEGGDAGALVAVGVVGTEVEFAAATVDEAVVASGVATKVSVGSSPLTKGAEGLLDVGLGAPEQDVRINTVSAAVRMPSGFRTFVIVLM